MKIICFSSFCQVIGNQHCVPNLMYNHVKVCDLNTLCKETTSCSLLQKQLYQIGTNQPILNTRPHMWPSSVSNKCETFSFNKTFFFQPLIINI